MKPRVTYLVSTKVGRWYATAAALLVPYVVAAATGIDIGTQENLCNTIKKVSNFGVFIVTGIAVIVFLIAGYNLLFGAGNEEMQKRGKEFLIYGIIGIVIVLIAATAPQLVATIFGVSSTCKGV